MNSFNKLIENLKESIIQIDTEKALKLIYEKAVILDIREREETESGIIPNSINIDRNFLEINIEKYINNKNKDIVVYCQSGTRSILASKTLIDMGYKNVFSLIDGINSWIEKDLPIKKPYKFSNNQLKRYEKQILLPEINKKGQEKIAKSKVLIVGAGGLGSPVIYYLTASGIGEIGIIDDDKVDLTNLHRQIIHFNNQIGNNKVDSAKNVINQLNPDTKVKTYKEKLLKKNALEIIKDYDLVIDCSDNFQTKYLINDACYFLKKPNIFGSIYKFDGQITLFNPNENNACYRCLFPNKPSNELIPNCSESGVIGVLPGLIGILQATEALKYILELPNLLINKLLTYDALTTDFNKIKYQKNKQCELCSLNTINELE